MALKKSKLSGINPRAYVGVEPSSPPALVSWNRSPTTGDREDFFVGDLWVNTPDEEVWILVNVDQYIAKWIQIGSSATFAVRFDADVGSAAPSAGELNIFGGDAIDTEASGNTVSIDMTAGTDGQVLIGGGAAPTLANITSTGGTITITNGPHSINLEATPVGLLQRLQGDNLGFAYPVAGIITVAGGTNITTVGGGGAGDELTTSLDDSIVLAGTLTISLLPAGVMQTSAAGVVTSNNGASGELLIGGGAAPAWANITSAGATVTIVDGANTINLEAVPGGTLRSLQGDSGFAYADGAGTVIIAGGTNITTTGGGGAGDELDISLNNSVTLAGTLTLSALGAGVMQTNAGGVVTSNNGANGELLIGGGAAPAWANITSTGGTVSITNGPNTINLESVGASPPFLYCQASDGGSGSLGGVGWYNIGAAIALTQIFDDGANVFPGDGVGGPAVFTCPSTGKYFLNMNIMFECLNNTQPYMNELVLEIVTSNRTYYHGLSPSITIPMENVSRKFSVCADMDTADTAQYRVKANFNTWPGTITVKGGLVADPVTWISGYLITT